MSIFARSPFIGCLLLVGAVTAPARDARADFVTRLDCRYTFTDEDTPTNNISGTIVGVPCPPYTAQSPRITADMRAYFGQIGLADNQLTNAQRQIRAEASWCCYEAVLAQAGGEISWCGNSIDLEIVNVYHAYTVNNTSTSAKAVPPGCFGSFCSSGNTLSLSTTEPFSADGSSVSSYNFSGPACAADSADGHDTPIDFAVTK